jgi:hypothetical protein
VGLWDNFWVMLKYLNQTHPPHKSPVIISIANYLEARLYQPVGVGLWDNLWVMLKYPNQTHPPHKSPVIISIANYL